MLVLNVAAGKFDPLPVKSEEDSMMPKFILNVDKAYYSQELPHVIEHRASSWEKDPDRITRREYLNRDVNDFMERTQLKFDRVCIYRYLEHVSFTDVLYFIYLVSTVTKKGALVDVIVPNYTILAEMLLNEDYYRENSDFDFEAHNILLTTELLNEPSCPHASIWTESRARYFWTLEKRFKIVDINRGFKFDGRDIYLRFVVERI
jgi:hypothetical protein